jgi:hypothetical protein
MSFSTNKGVVGKGTLNGVLKKDRQDWRTLVEHCTQATRRSFHAMQIQTVRSSTACTSDMPMTEAVVGGIPVLTRPKNV